jgi:hypothetical protein
VHGAAVVAAASVTPLHDAVTSAALGNFPAHLSVNPRKEDGPMMKQLLMALVLGATSLPALAAGDEPDAVACPTRRDLYEFLNAADRHDTKEATRLLGAVCRPLAGLHYTVEDEMNGVTTVRVFRKAGDWASSQLAYTLDEMVTMPETDPGGAALMSQRPAAGVAGS